MIVRRRDWRAGGATGVRAAGGKRVRHGRSGGISPVPGRTASRRRRPPERNFDTGHLGPRVVGLLFMHSRAAPRAPWWTVVTAWLARVGGFPALAASACGPKMAGRQPRSGVSRRAGLRRAGLAGARHDGARGGGGQPSAQPPPDARRVSQSGRHSRVSTTPLSRSSGLLRPCRPRRGRAGGLPVTPRPLPEGVVFAPQLSDSSVGASL